MADAVDRRGRVTFKAVKREPDLAAWPGSARGWVIDAATAAAVISVEVCVSQEAAGWSHRAAHHAPPGTLADVLLALGGAALIARRR
jgi:hypothetical protein